MHNRLIFLPPLPIPPPPLRRRRVHDGQNCGVYIGGAGTRGRLEGCDIVGNLQAGVVIKEGGDPTLVACKYGKGVRWFHFGCRLNACHVNPSGDALGREAEGDG